MDHPKTDSFKKARREKRSVTMVYILLRTSVVLVLSLIHICNLYAK